MGVPLADEAELLSRAVTMIQELTDLPLCIDSSVVEALEAGLAAYRGKALVNSVTGERERLEAILPLVKEHGAAVIALPNAEDEIPDEPRKRLEITRKIIDVAVGEYEIPIEDIVIDPLAMPVGADSTLVRKTLDTLELIRDEFGHCSAERALSGPGLVNLYQALGRRVGRGTPVATPHDVTALAEQGEPLARRARAMFFALLGTVAGNVALTLGALGGVYIAGGIVPRFVEAFAESEFRRRFEAKGRYRWYMERIPTYVITDPVPAFIGLKRLLEGR